MNNIELLTITKRRNKNDLKEWVDYHLAIGFEKITIIDNESEFSIQEFLSDYKNVEVIYFKGDLSHTGYGKQKSLAADFFMEKRGTTNWLGWFDDDEFLYVKNNVNILSLLNDDLETISFYWKFLSLPYIIETRNSSLIETFNYTTLQSSCENQTHIKTLVNMNKFTNINFPTAHLPILINTHQKTTMANGEFTNFESNLISGMEFYDCQPAVLYHYFHQSWDDWKYKCYKGIIDPNNPYLYRGRQQFESEIIGKYFYLDNSMVLKKIELGI